MQTGGFGGEKQYYVGPTDTDLNAVKFFILKYEFSGDFEFDYLASNVLTGTAILGLDTDDEQTANWVDHGADNDVDFEDLTDVLSISYDDTNTDIDGSPIDEIRLTTTWAELIAIPEPTTLIMLGLGVLLMVKRDRGSGR